MSRCIASWRSWRPVRSCCPTFSRDYVWRGTQTPRLLDSLNREWPVGSILLWDTSLKIPTKAVAVIQATPAGGKPAILLDGQQRLSTLARVMVPDAMPAGEKISDILQAVGIAELSRLALRECGVADQCCLGLHTRKELGDCLANLLLVVAHEPSVLRMGQRLRFQSARDARLLWGRRRGVYTSWS